MNANHTSHTGEVCASCKAASSTGRVICATCYESAASNLARLHERDERTHTCLLDELMMTMTRQARLGESLRSSSGYGDRPLPFEPHASQILSDDTAFLCDAAVHFGASELMRRVRSGRIAARWLADELPRLGAHSDVGTLVDELKWRVPRIVRIVDRPPSVWFAGKCLQCGADLYAEEGASVIACRCGERHDVAEQRQLLLAGIEDRLATAAEISRAVHLLDRPLSVSQVDNWVARGQLVRRGQSGAGHFLYRIGDVVELAAYSHERAQKRLLPAAARS